MFEEIKFCEIKENLTKTLTEDWALVTAGDDNGYNTMTVSWGAFGELWGQDTATIYIRPQRYTEEFLNKNDYFSICFFPSELKQQIHSVCGSKSGRDVDKVKEAKITPAFDENAPYFEEARIVLICRKTAKAKFTPEQFIDDSIAQKWYPQNDLHNIYYGTIEKAFIKK